jgi:protein phosphatase
MENSVATIHCSNHSCQAANPLSNKLCHKCRTPIVRRYLRAVGQWLTAFRVGELVGDRYLLVGAQILLDTQPGTPPLAPEEVPDNLLLYLKLLPYRLHVPQVYGYLPSPDERMALDIWLLEYGSVPTQETGELKYEELFPKLTEIWSQATALRQLNWLWQIACLWEPLHNKGVVSSLLDPSLVRVNGTIVRLLELKFDEEPEITLSQLGQLWSQWSDRAAPTIAEFVQKLCQNLVQGKITRPGQLIALLEGASASSARSQEQTYHIYTCSDAGPTRDHNEDACYPPSGEVSSIKEQEKALAIVCDGIGGQEGGEIASQLAIDSLVEESSRLLLDTSESNSHIYEQALERAICATNDLISDRNDSEHRQERQRMGTTLVMGLARAHELYIAHVGDSRVYWITPTSCYQVTVDDDLASREVRLGYLLYREAILYPNAGALVQALGMSSSPSLHPTVQHFILDDDCVFLLCSDGLSDFDRVEQYWESELVPILDGKQDIKSAGKRLLDLANQKNGHDNVTIAIVHCQVRPKANVEATPIIYPEFEAAESTLPEFEEFEDDESAEDTILSAATVALPSPDESPMSLGESEPPQRQPWLLAFLLTAFGLLVLGGGYWWWQQSQTREENLHVPLRTTTSETPPTTPEPAFSPAPPPIAGELIKISTAIALLESPAVETSFSVPEGSILKVLPTEPNPIWLKLQVCQNAPQTTRDSNGSEQAKLPPETTVGWIEWETLKAKDFELVEPASLNCPVANVAEPSQETPPTP